MQETEVLIVGAGLAGLSVAWHLAQTGIGSRIQVLEQGSGPAREASAQNAGMLRRFSLDPEERERAQRSFAAIQRLPREDWAVSPFRRTGSILGLAEERASHRAAAETLRDEGIRIEELEPGDRAKVAPILDRSPIETCFWLPDEGTCDPGLLAEGFLRGAERRGVRFHCDQRVAGFEIDAEGAVHGVRLADGSLIRAETTILCTAAWTPLLAPEAGLRPLARHLWQSAPHPLSSDQHPWCWIDDIGVYAKPEAGGFLCSPCDEELLVPSPGPGSAAPTRPSAESDLREKLERFLPALSSLGLDRGWRGLRTFAPDRVPRVGPDPERKGLFWATGLGGSGLSTCWALGEDVARALVPAPD